MTTPFDFINSINSSKVNIFLEDPANERVYDSFMVNRGMSYFQDTLFHSNEMNKYSGSPKNWQYDFYLNSVTKRKRFSKWSKADKVSDDATLLSLLYGYSKRRALEALSLIPQEEMKVIRQSYATGGR